jgi:hypothetical protein
VGLADGFRSPSFVFCQNLTNQKRERGLAHSGSVNHAALAQSLSPRYKAQAITDGRISIMDYAKQDRPSDSTPARSASEVRALYLAGASGWCGGRVHRFSGLGVLLAVFCWGASARAELIVPSATVNLGEIRGGMPLQVSFSLQNAGSERIEILEVNRGCDCLTPRLDKRILMPGDKTTLLMALRTLGHANGPHTWTATLRFREGESVRGLPLGIRATVVNDVTVQPAVCALFVEKTLRQEVTLTDLRKPPLSVTRAETTTPAVTTQIRLLNGGVTKIILEAKGVGLASGRHDEMLTIYTSDSSYNPLHVPITLVRLSEQAVLASPEQVELVGEPGQPIPATLVRLRPRGDQAVVVDKVVADDPGVLCTWAAGPGNHATLKIQVDTMRPIDTSIHVHLREPVQEVLIIPVQIRFR